LLRAIVEVANQIDRGDDVSIILIVESVCENIAIFGRDSRLGQVFNNLIDNARSFSACGGIVRITLQRAPDAIRYGQKRPEGFEIIFDDDGPGIPAHAFERIFERFYTDRPNQSFGNNSGLGLSISRQIVEAHGGTVDASNRIDDEDRILGARFTVFLPAP
jgi:two-component system sensor histidine kinase ChvG